MKKHIILSSLFVLGMIVGPAMMFAQTNPRGGGGGGGPQNVKQIESPSSATSVAEVLNAFFGILIQVGAVVVTLAIVYAGFLFVVARGNPEELNKAKETLKWTIIGALVLLGAQVISKVIENTIKSIGA